MLAWRYYRCELAAEAAACCGALLVFTGLEDSRSKIIEDIGFLFLMGSVFCAVSLLYFLRSFFQREEISLEKDELRHVAPYWSMRDFFAGVASSGTVDSSFAWRAACTVVRRETVRGIMASKEASWGPVVLDVGVDGLPLGATLNDDERLYLAEILRAWMREGPK